MPEIKSFDHLLNLVKEKPSKRVVVVMGEDPNTIGAAIRAAKDNIAEMILVGHPEKIADLLKEKGAASDIARIVPAMSEKEAAGKAVSMIRANDADILMKGLVGTGNYMKAILHKEQGLLTKGNILSHVTVLDVPTYDKLLFVSDVAIIPAPDLGQKQKMIDYTVAIAHKFGIDVPKVAVLTANEKVSDRMPATMEAAILSKMNDRKQIKGCVVDGPLALDVAISSEACAIKGLKSPVQGYADILIFPDIEAGNIFYKGATILAKARLAAIVTGANAPCILTSRADSDESKFLSIVLASQVA